MEDLSMLLRPWLLWMGITLFITGGVFVFAPGLVVSLSKSLDSTFDLERAAKFLDTTLFNIDRWIIKNIKWLGIVALSDAAILLVVYFVYLR